MLLKTQTQSTNTRAQTPTHVAFSHTLGKVLQARLTIVSLWKHTDTSPALTFSSEIVEGIQSFCYMALHTYQIISD